jgi:hypothetical protein
LARYSYGGNVRAVGRSFIDQDTPRGKDISGDEDIDRCPAHDIKAKLQKGWLEEASPDQQVAKLGSQNFSLLSYHRKGREIGDINFSIDVNIVGTTKFLAI